MLDRRTWVLVCDASRARIFQENGRQGLEELEGFSDIAARQRVHDRVSARAGLKRFGGSGHRFGSAPASDPMEAEAQKFAHFLAEILKKALHDHAFDELVLAAPPHFLGMLRHQLDGQVVQRVVASFDRDYTTLDVRELDERLHAPGKR